MDRSARAALIALLLPTFAAAGPEEDLRTSADQVVAAFEAKDAPALKALAKEDDPDPWLVADELCARGAHDAAEAFAKAAPRPDTNALPDYVATRRGAADTPESRRAWSRARAAIEAGRATEALAALERVDARAGSVLEQRARALRARAMAALGRPGASAAAYLGAARQAKHLGWLRAQAAALYEASSQAVAAGDPAAGKEHAAGALELDRARGDRVSVALDLRVLAIAEREAGEDAAAARTLEQALRATEDRGEQAKVLHDLGIVLKRLGRFDEALAGFERCRELTPDPIQAVAATLNMGVVEEVRGAPEKALAHAKRGLAAARRLEQRAWHARALDQTGRLLVVLGRRREALETCAPLPELWLELGAADKAALWAVQLGQLRHRVGDAERAATELERAAAMAREAGLPVVEAQGRYELGLVHARLGDPRRAVREHLRAAALFERAGATRDVAYNWFEAGHAFTDLSEMDRAVDAYERAGRLAERCQDRVLYANALAGVGYVHFVAGRNGKALGLQERALALLRGEDDERALTHVRIDLGKTLQRVGRFAEAARLFEEGLRSAEARADALQIVACIDGLAWERERRGDLAGSLELHRRARRRLEGSGETRAVLIEDASIAEALERTGAYEEALDLARATVERARAGTYARVEASALGTLGNILYGLGDYAAARDSFTRAIRLHSEQGNRSGRAAQLGNLGRLHQATGEYAKALTCQEEVLAEARRMGELPLVANTLGLLAIVHDSLGNRERVRRLREESIAITRELEDRHGLAWGLLGLATVELHDGDHAAAQARLAEALRLARAIGVRDLEVQVLLSLGLVLRRAGDASQARERLEEALALAREHGLTAREPDALYSLARALDALGRADEARRRAGEALALAERHAHRDTVVNLRWLRAELALDGGDTGAALREARAAVESMDRFFARLGESEGVVARSRWSEYLAIGVRAALRANDPEELCFFIESSRAGTLNEALGGREAIHSAVVPQELRREESAARARLRQAQARYRDAVAKKRRPEIRAARDAIERAGEQAAAALARVQRSQKSAAALPYPRPGALEGIQATLDAETVLVLYALLEEESAALVVSKDGARTVRLGDTGPIVAACRSLGPRDRDADDLRRKVVAPLALDEGVRRVLVSPDGPLTYVPFTLLVGDRSLAYVPSGATLGLLSGEARGTGVLALGDPAYEASAGGKRRELLRGGELRRLPATREEARAVGTRLLLGADATPEELRSALLERPRWRAVHLACHGLVDPEHPLLSSLALALGKDGNALLTTMDLLRLRIPADLAVLSACETAKGKLYRAEGLVGFARALMIAGARRVIVSLWKVDDEATKALMVKFYELWNPKDGSDGLPTAVALRRAQEFVRGGGGGGGGTERGARPATAKDERRAKWSHPYYWAAWQLWGLPD